MYLKKFKLIPEKRNNKFFFNSFHPFSAFKTSKIKNDFLKQIIKYKEKENICVSSFGIDTSKLIIKLIKEIIKVQID